MPGLPLTKYRQQEACVAEFAASGCHTAMNKSLVVLLSDRLSCSCILAACLALQDGDVIAIDAEKRVMDIVNVSDEELVQRRAAWTAPPLKATSGTLYKYIKNVTSASEGCVTDA